MSAYVKSWNSGRTSSWYNRTGWLGVKHQFTYSSRTSNDVLYVKCFANDVIYIYIYDILRAVKGLIIHSYSIDNRCSGIQWRRDDLDHQQFFCGGFFVTEICFGRTWKIVLWNRCKARETRQEEESPQEGFKRKHPSHNVLCLTEEIELRTWNQ